MNCPSCNHPANRFGKDRKDNQRYRCKICKKTFTEPQQKHLNEMRLPLDKALSCLHHLVEGCSIRTTERITEVQRNTIMALLLLAGERCERLMEDRIRNVPVKDVQCDEIWSFVGCKQKTKERLSKDGDTLGDAYTFVAIERNTKLILAWHLGHRTYEDTVIFAEKLARATYDHSFQISTDGFPAYRDAIVLSLGAKKVAFAQIIKSIETSGEVETQKAVIFGNPDPSLICTSHVERQNLTIRMAMRRFTRKTNGFSKKWLNLKSGLALHFAYYNFCRVHMSLRVTPAMEAGITDHIWSLSELLAIRN
jgi:transposase-like protein/IS1 family transposase